MRGVLEKEKKGARTRILCVYTVYYASKKIVR